MATVRGPVKRGPTPSQTVGPFFGFALPFPGDHQAVPPNTPGARRIEGQVLDGAGAPVPDAVLEVWEGEQFARCCTDPEGAFQLVVLKPEPVPLGDGRRQAPHLHMAVFARGLLRHVLTRLYFPEEAEANAADPVLGLIADPAARQTMVARDEGGVLRFDVRLQGDGETVFIAF